MIRARCSISLTTALALPVIPLLAQVRADRPHAAVAVAATHAAGHNLAADTGGFASYRAPVPTRPAGLIAYQGLIDASLVAGKSTLFRVFTEGPTFDAATQVSLSVLRPDGSTITRTVDRGQLLALPSSTAELPSYVVRIDGGQLPWTGSYSAEARVIGAAGPIATYRIADLVLLPTRDLRLIVTYISKAGDPEITPDSSWDRDVRRAMNRLGAMFPVRDGVQPSLNGQRNAGLRYVIGTACDGWLATFNDCQYQQTRSINASAGDHIDVSIEFRPGIYAPVCRESPCGPGGNSGRPAAPYSDLPRASCVSGNFRGILMTAPCFAQEIGHNFGLEPAGSPHFQDVKDPGHSKDAVIPDPDGYDLVNNRLFARIGDTMNNLGGGAMQGVDAVMFNAYDWEYLRQRFMGISSTGPTAPTSFTSEFSPSIAAVGNTLYFFATRADGRIYSNRAVTGQAGTGWQEIEGGGRAISAPSAAAVGDHVFVGVLGKDGIIYLNQADLNGAFGQWLPMGFRSKVPPGLAAVGKSIFVFATAEDGRIFLNQAELGHAFSGWFEVQGGGRTDRAPAAAAVGNHVFVAVKGLDNQLYMNQADFGHAFGQWFPMGFQSPASPGLSRVGNSIFVFATSTDQRIYLNQAVLGKAFSGWFEVQGGGRAKAGPTSAAIGSHVFVSVQGLDGYVYLNQADFGHAFGQWFH